MAFCSGCGSAIETSTRFCARCGTANSSFGAPPVPAPMGIKAACQIMDSVCRSPQLGLYDWQKEAWERVKASLIHHVKI